jgi:cell division protein FtsB
MGRKSDLHLNIILAVFYSYCILHNLTIRRGIVNVDDLMRRIVNEAEEEVSVLHSSCLDFQHGAFM